MELTSIELLELNRPIDLVPSNECVEVRLGTISSDKCTLALNLHSTPDEKVLNFIDADTRGKIRFPAKFYVSCDEKSSFKSFILDFRPDKNDWVSTLLEDYTEEHLSSVTWPKF